MNWPFGELKPFSFDFLMADPPWLFDTYSVKGKQKSPEKHYRCLPIDQIAAFPVGHLAAGNAVLWMWGTHPMIDQQLWVMKQWGFRFVTSGVWVKRTKNGKLSFGTGYRLRSASEPFLIGVNGDPTTARTVRTVIEGRVRRHSEKPEEGFAAAEEMMPEARRVEIFSRTNRPDWTSWGDEVGKFGEAA